MQYKDYYKMLGVNRNASQEEIQKAYRSLHGNITPMPIRLPGLMRGLRK